MHIYKNDKSLTYGFCLLQVGLFCIVAVHSGFFPLLLARSGCDSVMVGQVATVTGIVSLFSQPLLGIFCDRLRANRIIYLIAGICAPVSYLGILRADNFAGILFWSCLFVGIGLGVQFLSDGWIASLNAQGHKIDFGFSRGAGSFSFAIASVVIGLIVDRLGMESLGGLMILFGGTMALFAMLLPPPAPTERTGQKDFMAVLRQLLRNKRYLVLVFCNFMFSFPFAAFMTYFSIFYTEEGASDSLLGIAFFVLSIVEVPVMLCYSRLERRFGVETMLLVAILGHGLKSLCLGFVHGLPLITAALLLQAFGFALSIPATQSMIASCTDPACSSTAQTLCASFGGGLGRITANLFCTWLVSFTSLRNVFIITSLFAFAAALFFFFTIWIPAHLGSPKKEAD